MIADLISEKWTKAAILGTIWASSEIVLGSFLHNLKIPFSGNILTAIALIILISANYRWNLKGLFWRAGIICAVLKTMSPSAVIFGPMVAIIAEAFLLELAVRLLGRNILGYIVGAALAMSWVLFQKLANYIIYYGNNIIEVYESLMNYAEKQLNWQFDGVWLPILALLAIYVAFGILAGILGIKSGKKLVDQHFAQEDISVKEGQSFIKSRVAENFNYSVWWLLINLLIMISSLVLLRYLPIHFWAIMIVIFVTIWAIRYKRAMRQLIRPKFWIFFVFITMLTAFVFTKIQNKELYEGLLIGVEMNLRAILLIMGFTALGTELYNPVIRNYFGKSRFRQLSMAIELSVESLPLMISNVPDFKSFIRNPFIVVRTMMVIAENRIAEFNIKPEKSTKTFIVHGSVGEGKTTFLKDLIKLLSETHKIGGIISPRIMEDEITTGYDVLNISSNDQKAFLSTNPNEDLECIGKYYIQPEGLQFGIDSILGCLENNVDIIIIDEVGRLEFEDKGWASALRQVLSLKQTPIILGVRDEFVGKAIEVFHITDYQLINLKDTDISSTFVDITNRF